MEYSSANPIRLLILDEDVQVVETIDSFFPPTQYHCVTTTRAMVALELLEEAPFHAVICGMSFPGMSGLEVLRQGLTRVPRPAFVMLSSPDDRDSSVEAMRLGAYDCLRKPFESEELLLSVERALERQRLQTEAEMFRMLLGTTLQERAEHLHNVLEQVGEIRLSLLEMLVVALDTREHHANLHSLRVRRFSRMLAEKCGFGAAQIKTLSYGALLHDIGKIAIPDSILLKPGKLTNEEFQVVQQHSMFGYQVLSRIPHFQDAATVALFHHERMDGEGYPMRARGDAIPLPARIFALADTLDTIIAGRPYCPARTLPEARLEVRRCSGSQFDPHLVDLFMDIPDEQWLSAHDDVSERYRNAFPLFPIKAGLRSMT